MTIFGGSGFLGQQIAKKLIKNGAIVKIASRFPERASHLMTLGFVGQVSFVKCNLLNEKSIRDALKNSDIAINAVGILNEKNSQNFKNIHVKSAKIMARNLKDLGVKQFLYVSALGVEESKEISAYGASKFEAESIFSAICSQTIILRPSVIFGENDSFSNNIKTLLKFLPFFPLIGGGKTKFQPVYVEDVATSVLKILQEEEKFNGKIFELAGPEIFSLKEIVNAIKIQTKQQTSLVSVPFYVARIMVIFLKLLPCAILSADQLALLRLDNVIKENTDALLFKNLRMRPESFEKILPTYL